MHYFVTSTGGHGGPGGGGPGGGGPGGRDGVGTEISTWVRAHYPSTAVGDYTVYDLTAAAR